MLKISNNTGQLIIVGYYKCGSSERCLMSIDKRSFIYFNDESLERFTDKTLTNIKSNRLTINRIVPTESLIEQHAVKTIVKRSNKETQ